MKLAHASFTMLQSGHCFDLVNPEGSDFSILDIASSLSKICRFTGHVHRDRFYSVAEHSVNVSLLVPPRFALAGLLHDAAEFILQDIASPLKRLLPDYRALEARIERVIFKKFGVDGFLVPHMHPLIKEADLVMLATERRDLMPLGVGGDESPWAMLAGVPLRTEPVIGLEHREARALFIERYMEVTQ